MKWKTYVVSVLIALAVGGLSALLTSGNMMISDELVQPPLAPPAILFPIVWTILYVAMGIGAARVCIVGKGMKVVTTEAIKTYAAQLAVNFFWSIIFFNFRAFLLAFLWLILLWILILVMLVRFAKVDDFATIINIPYLVWVTFAGYLNFMIYILN